MATSVGIVNASGNAVQNPLPPSWINHSNAPSSPQSWIPAINVLSFVQLKLLAAQIAYDKSQWDNTKIGTENQLGRYQTAPALLEAYGLLSPGSVAEYGIDAVNYLHCWMPIYQRKSASSYINYMFNITSLRNFLTNVSAQDQLEYQIISNTYTSLLKNTAITAADTAEVVAGMIYVGLELGTDAAHDWRYQGTGTGANAYNSGRYAVTVLTF
jgi:hypothetical protein